MLFWELAGEYIISICSSYFSFSFFAQGIRNISLYYTEDDPPLRLATNFTLSDLDSDGAYSGNVYVTVTDVADGDLEKFEFTPAYGIRNDQTSIASVDTNFVAQYLLKNGTDLLEYDQVQ